MDHQDFPIQSPPILSNRVPHPNPQTPHPTKSKNKFQVLLIFFQIKLIYFSHFCSNFQKKRLNEKNLALASFPKKKAENFSEKNQI
jgi:hypothetical protein